MQLSTKTEQFGVEDQRWLGSKHAVDTARTVTIKADTLAALAVDGLVPSGVPLKKSASGGTYEPVTADGDELAGFLLTTQAYVAGAGDVVAPLLDHGRIRVDKLPAGVHDVTGLSTPNPHFIFVKDGE